MNYRKLASVYSLIVGFSMLGMWFMFYVTDGIPEIKTKPVELSMHIAAEILTAVMLISGAIGLLLHKKWGLNIHLISIGMLLYTLIMSPGYFLQKGEVAFVSMFLILLILTLGFTVLLLMKD